MNSNENIRPLLEKTLDHALNFIDDLDDSRITVTQSLGVLPGGV